MTRDSLSVANSPAARMEIPVAAPARARLGAAVPTAGRVLLSLVAGARIRGPAGSAEFGGSMRLIASECKDRMPNPEDVIGAPNLRLPT